MFLDVEQYYQDYWHICAIDDATMEVAPLPVYSIGQLKSATTSGGAQLSSETVTYIAPDPVEYNGQNYTKAYLEEDNRSAGIAVLFGSSQGNIPVVGNKVSVTGALVINQNEATLMAYSWTVDSAAYPLASPLGMAQRSLGGAAFNQPALYASHGLCNVGLRVRVSGNVTSVNDNVVYIDDGSGLLDHTSIYGGVPVYGVPVANDQNVAVNVGDYLSVTGVLSIDYYDPDGIPFSGDNTTPTPSTPVRRTTGAWRRNN